MNRTQRAERMWPGSRWMIWGALLVAVGCEQAARSAEPVKVAQAEDPDVVTGLPGQDTGEVTAPDAGLEPAGSDDAAASDPVPGGLWVLDAKGVPVGLLVQRGHPHHGDSDLPDLLRDGVLVYAPGPGLFFGLSMATGEVLVPRLGVLDGACDQPLVAGYYAAGPEISGMDYGFAWRGSWYRIAPAAAVKLVECAGTTKQGVKPKCVLHSGTCRGFPVEKISPKLPLAFPAPMKFAWKGAIP